MNRWIYFIALGVVGGLLASRYGITPLLIVFILLAIIAFVLAKAQRR